MPAKLIGNCARAYSRGRSFNNYNQFYQAEMAGHEDKNIRGPLRPIRRRDTPVWNKKARARAISRKTSTSNVNAAVAHEYARRV